MSTGYRPSRIEVLSIDIEGLWRQWWRVGGAFGIGFVILFIIGPVVLQGSTPHRDDSIEEIRRYFTDDRDRYLAAEYIGGIAFLIFFLPYVVTLRWLLGSGEGWPPIWSWLTVVGGVAAAVLAGAASVFWGALAIGAATNPEVEDSSVRTLMELDTYGRSVLVALPMALFVGAASVVVWRTGVLWRWLAILGLLAAVLLLTGAAWPIDGDEEGLLAKCGQIGAMGTALWILVSSISMLLRTEEPASTDRAAAD